MIRRPAVNQNRTMIDDATLAERLRDRIVGALHVGRVRPGDRLPGMREVSRETGANQRTVAKAYRILEREGLVEIRERSGIYAARQDHWGGKLLAETGKWLGGILFDAWKRHIPIPELADLIRGCTVGVNLHAAVIDGTEDLRRAICTELDQAFGIACSEWELSALSPGAAGAVEVSGLPREVREAELLVTTPYHAAEVRAAAAALSRPFVVVTLHPELVDAVERSLGEGPLSIVCADPAFGDRIRGTLPEALRERARVVLVDDREELARLDPDEPVLLTHAAQERLGGVRLTPLLPSPPFISPDSARELAELRIRLHMEAEHARTHGSAPAG